MNLTTRIYAALFGKLVGSDAFGNRYYAFATKRLLGGSRRHGERRWVLYSGQPEASKVPAEWHGWLHHTLALPPTQREVAHHAWEKPHLPNLTGTAGAYLPQGHLSRGAQHAPTVADYEAWQP